MLIMYSSTCGTVQINKTAKFVHFKECIETNLRFMLDVYVLRSHNPRKLNTMSWYM